MEMSEGSTNIKSPVQQHKIIVANDMQWITGELKSLGIPYNYINRDTLDCLNILDAQICPWSFTGLPTSRAHQTIVLKNKVQLLLFPDPRTKEDFRPPIRTSTIMLQTPLAVVRGEAPFLSEAILENFLDFWKPTFFPMMNVNIHFLADCAVELPKEIDILFINRESILSYVGG
jgi:hypothetical protein